MSEIERMTIALPAPMAAAIRGAVDAGEYATASEVIRDALRLWQTRRDFTARDLEKLRQRFDDGKASGLAGSLDMGALIAREKGKRSSRA